MKIAPLTIQQYRSLQGQEFNSDSFFNPTATADGTYFISEEEITQYNGTTFAWIKDLTLIDYSTDIPDTTPPQMTGLGLLIPQKATDSDLDLFPDNKFEMGGFVIEFTQTSQGLAIDLAYLGWEAFRIEQLKPINLTVKKTFSKLWDTVANDYMFSVQNPNESKIIQL
jgi:hypothetical protein